MSKSSNQGDLWTVKSQNKRLSVNQTIQHNFYPANLLILVGSAVYEWPPFVLGRIERDHHHTIIPSHHHTITPYCLVLVFISECVLIEIVPFYLSQLGSQDEEREEPKKTVRQDSVELEKQKEDLKQFHKTFNVSTAGLCGAHHKQWYPRRGYESIQYITVYFIVPTPAVPAQT